MELWQWLEKAAGDENKKDQLRQYVAELIEHDFEKLIWLLYKVDVNEAELRAALKETPAQEAAEIITAKIMKRLQQKAESRKKFRMDPPASDEETW